MPEFYVYVLFDHQGIPRYVGKGNGDRWLIHGRRSTQNKLKDNVLKRTLAVLGEIPRVKIHEGLTETGAYSIEVELIKTIGRLDLGTGPLTNLTAGGEGVDGEKTRAVWQRMTLKERREYTAKARSAAQIALKNYWNEMSPDDRRIATLRAITAMTQANRIRIGSMTETERHQMTVAAVAGRQAKRLTKTVEERGAGARAMWQRRSPEERSIIARKAAITRIASHGI